jgi:hypothetical protein
MKTLQPRWITVKFQENMFDVKLLNQTIDEIRAVDSEVNILNLIDQATLHKIQKLAKEKHHAV